MKIKTSIIIGVAILLTTLVSIATISTFKVEGNTDLPQMEIPVVIKPMKIGNDIVPVEIQCKRVFITRPDILDDFSCILINRTNKSIRSAGVSYSIIIDTNGKEEQDGRLDTTDTYIHPDLSEIKKPIEPGGRLFVTPPGPIAEHGSVIKRLELEPVYIEFADGSAIGGGISAGFIANVREGAARFKNALRQEYLNRGKSAQAILPLLEENAPIGSDIQNFQQRAGAKAYRRFLRNKNQKNGGRAVEEILTK